MRLGKWKFVVVLLACAGILASACDAEPPASVPTTGVDCKKPPVIGPGARLSGCSMVGLVLEGVDLSGADLRGANLTGANLANADLTGANLTGANLTNANLSGANLTNAVLAGTFLLGALFVGAILTGTSFDFGTVFGAKGNGGSNKPTGSSCSGPYCPGYNEVNSPHGPGRTLCSTGSDAEPAGDDEDDFFLIATTEQLAASGSRSVVTDQWTSFRGATFDYSGSPDSGNGVALLRGLDLRSADFTDATFIDTYLACKDANGARFAGTQFTTTENAMGGFFHVSMRNTDFTSARIITHYFCDVDFSDATMKGIVIGGASFISCPEMLPAEVFNELPDALVVFDGADMSNASIGVTPNPSATGPSAAPGLTVTMLAIEPDIHAPGSIAKHSTFLGTNLDGAHFANVGFIGADFTGASVDGATVSPGVSGQSWFNNAIFGAGWTNTSWSGTIHFNGAACPDGSTGSDTNPCFPVGP